MENQSKPQKNGVCVIDAQDDVVAGFIPKLVKILIYLLDPELKDEIKKEIEILKGVVQKARDGNQKTLDNQTRVGRELCQLFAQYYADGKTSSPDEARQFRETMNIWDVLTRRVASLDHILHILQYEI